MISTLTPAKRRALIGIHDLVMTALAVAASFWLRLGDTLTPDSRFFETMVTTLVLTVPLALVAYLYCGLYRGIWRYASVQDLTNIVKAASIIAVAMVAIDYFGRGSVVIPRTVVVVFWFMLIVLLGAPRLMYRVFREFLQERKVANAADVTNVLAVGTGPDTELLLRTVQSTARPTMRVVGIVAQRVSEAGQTLRGVPVLGLVSEFDAIIAKLDAKGMKPRRLVFSQKALARPGDAEALIAAARRHDITASRLSNATLTSGEAHGGLRLAPIRIEDMLMRPHAQMDMTAIRALIGGRSVLVTGGGGSIGSEICKQVAAIGASHLTVVENSELALYQITRQLEGINPNMGVRGVIADVRERDAIDAIFADMKPELVFHAAALKHVPIVEFNRRAGAMTNTIGTRVVADAAMRHGARTMVLISTDKAIKPTSFMGATKRAAELYCQALDAQTRAARRKDGGAGGTRFVSVRFGNVLASAGSVLWVFQEQIERGGPVTVTHPDMERYFMTVREATSLVLMASAHANAGGDANAEGDAGGDEVAVYVLDMGEPVKIVELARRMIRLAGFEPDRDIAIVYSGIRPGERLFESLFNQEEQVERLDVAGVFAARPRREPLAELRKTFKQLEEACLRRDDAQVVALIHRLVPEYGAEDDADAGEQPAGEAPGQAAGRGDGANIVYLKEGGR